MSQAIEVPAAVSSLTNEQLLAVWNRWGTKTAKKFESRKIGEARVARLLSDLEMTVEQTLAPPESAVEGCSAEPQEALAQNEQTPTAPPVAESEAAIATMEPEPETSMPTKTNKTAAKAAPAPEKPEAKFGTAQQAILKAASRKNGATAAELMQATGWTAGPSWPEQFRRLSLRAGKKYRQERVDGLMRYYLS